MKIAPDWYLQYAKNREDKAFENITARPRRKVIRLPVVSKGEKTPRTAKDLVENLTIKEVASHLRCHVNHVYQLIHSGRLRFQPIGRRKVVPVTALNEYKEAERQRYYAQGSK